MCPHCKVPHADVDRYASFPHWRHLFGNCKKWFDTDNRVVCNVLSGWAPVLKGEQLWLNKAAPKEFAGEVTELVADLTVLPKGGLEEFSALFKHEE